MYDSLIAMLRANSEEDRKYHRERREENERRAREKQKQKEHMDNLAD